jgi:TPR repeat protein
MRLWIAMVAVSSLAYADDAADQKACKAGKGKMCLALGQAALKENDKPHAFELYSKACTLKVGEGCGLAATMQMDGDGIDKDVAKAHALRGKACDLGHAPSCNDLGAAWSEGKEGADKVDFAKAKAMYEKACKLEDGLGCFNYGNVFREGEGEKVDLKKAFANFEKSCKLDAAKGCTELGIMYYEGKAVAKNKDKAVEALTKACKLGSDVACKNVELLKAAK